MFDFSKLRNVSSCFKFAAEELQISVFQSKCQTCFLLKDMSLQQNSDQSSTRGSCVRSLLGSKYSPEGLNNQGFVQEHLTTTRKKENF